MRAPTGTPEDDAARGPEPPADRGHAIAEFALVLPLLLLLVMATIDFGHLVQTRLILTNVSREGGSIISREASVTDALVGLLVASGQPLDLAGAEGRVYVTRVAAGPSAADPSPRLAGQVTRGGLAVDPAVTDAAAGLGLTAALHDRLTFDAVQGAPDITEVTVVEVYYRYRPITPIPNLVAGILGERGSGLVLSSRAVF